MTSSGFAVNTEALRRFAEHLRDFESEAGRFADRVGAADVTDTSWGVVGMATKDIYRAILGQSQDYLRGMHKRLDDVANRLIEVANQYDHDDAEIHQRIAAIVGELGGEPMEPEPCPR